MYQLILKENANRFLSNSDLYDLANDLVDRVDYQEENDESNIYGLIADAANDSLIYYADQWIIVENYSMPDAPKIFSAAVSEFIDDVVCCVEFVEIDE